VGAIGPAGPPGPPGPAGSQGKLDPLAPSSPPGGLASYVYRFSTNCALTIFGGDDFQFGNGNVPKVPTGITLPNATDTVLSEAGCYEISFRANVIGSLTSISINRNGTPIPGGTEGAVSGTNEIKITAFVEINESNTPATITISNNSFSTIGFPTLPPGSVAASLIIKKLS
jgi:hypothetical protein